MRVARWQVGTAIAMFALQAAAAVHTVHVTSNIFTPAVVDIQLGDEVEWINDQGTHNVRADDGAFRSGDPASAPWTFRRSFSSAGEFGYYCEPHGSPGSGMAGTVRVGSGPFSQTIVFGSAPSLTVGAFATVTATGGGSGNPVVFSSQTNAICTTGGTNGSSVTGVSAGTCTIAANQAGNSNFNAAPQAIQSFNVGQGSQTIAFGTLVDRIIGDPPITVSATGGASGNPVTFASRTAGVCATGAANGSTVTLLNAGVCTLRASQAGNSNYLAAPDVDRSFTVGAAGSGVSLRSGLNPVNAGQSVTLTATVTGIAPTGTVGFKDAAADIFGCSSAGLAGSSNARTAECATSTLAPGIRALTAVYSGDGGNAGSTSDVLMLRVNALPRITTPGVSALSILEDSSSPAIAITVSDAETAAGSLALTATSTNLTLISDAALARGLGGSGADRVLTLTPTANQFGSATIVLSLSDGIGVANTTFGLVVTAVNDAPSLTLLGHRSHGNDAMGAQSVASFASVNPGPNESGQTLVFDVLEQIDVNAVVDAIGIDADGTLRYTLSGNSGGAVFEVAAQDNGGTANGGIDTSEVREFRILVGTGANIVVAIQRTQPPTSTLMQALRKGATLANYEVNISNLGPLNVAGLMVSIPAPQALSGVLWTCTTPSGTCAPANGSTSVSTSLDLNLDQTATVTLSGNVNTAISHVEISASAQLPAGLTALSTGEERAVFIEPANATAMHRSGFE